MAPRRGGGGGGGYGGGDSDGGDSGSSSSSCDSDWPCSTEMTYMYGESYTSLYSSTELLGQLVLYAIWLIVLTGLIFQSYRLRPGRPVALILAMVLLWISYVFLVVRFGLMVGNSNVPIGYRYESSIVVLLQRLGLPCLFLAVTQQLPSSGGKVTKMILRLAIAAYAALNIVYLVFDFLISAQAVIEFEVTWVWRLGDRDVALTLTPEEIVALTMADGGYGGLSPSYVEERFWEYSGHVGVKDRANQIKFGVAAAFVALAIAGVITGVAGLTFVRQRSSPMRGMVWMFPAAMGLLLLTIFGAVVNTYFLLWNWTVINDLVRWDEWIQSYPSVDLYNIVPPTEFLDGYRTAVDGFPIVQAVLEPLGVVVTCAAVYTLARLGIKTNGLTVSNGAPKA